MHRPWVPVVAALALLLAGCAGNEEDASPDSDFDYLSDDDERAGWDITIRRQAARCDAPPAQPRPGETLHVDSDPNVTDTDGDGVTDSEESVFRSHPRANDTDEDGLSDFDEAELNRGDRLQQPGGLRLWDADSDSDCLPDPVELAGYDVPGIGWRTTDPSVADTDSDGWTDGYERFVSRTDPVQADTDGDGAGDKVDVDPHQDVALNLTFVRFLVKPGANRPAGAEFDVRFVYQFSGPSQTLVQPPDPSPTFRVRVGANATVGPQHSPGLRDVNDATADPRLRIQFWIERTDRSETLQVYEDPSSPGEPIVTLFIHPKSRTWSTAGGERTGSTDAVAVLESSMARLEFFVRVAAR